LTDTEAHAALARSIQLLAVRIGHVSGPITPLAKPAIVVEPSIVRSDAQVGSGECAAHTAHCESASHMAAGEPASHKAATEAAATRVRSADSGADAQDSACREDARDLAQFASAHWIPRSQRELTELETQQRSEPGYPCFQSPMYGPSQLVLVGAMGAAIDCFERIQDCVSRRILLTFVAANAGATQVNVRAAASIALCMLISTGWCNNNKYLVRHLNCCWILIAQVYAQLLYLDLS
jgi:hypothetical protein